ncbi:TIGR02679 family protein [uncultured Jatrophihabitans sp.]|uniref:TIGR02679 family protein n=1 Tax=uncultured Jatrophihabitans sp. TaxID=1610747 RepID=UPI0035C9EFD0
MSDRTGDRSALERLLGGAETAWLVQRVRGRIVAARDEPLTGVVQLREPTGEQRAGVVRLVGPSRRAGEGLRVDLAAVEEVLRRGPWPAGLADAVQTLTGPVVDSVAERQRDTAEWEAARRLLSGAAARFTGLAEWWDGWCAAGGLKRSARAEAGRTGRASGPAVASELVGDVARVLVALPSSGEPLAMLARRTVGDAHALDSSRPLGRLAATVVGEAFAPGQPVPVRDAWAAAGVVLSNVASTVLCLGVPGRSAVDEQLPPGAAGVATSTALEAMRTARMPVVLTLDQVRSDGVAALPSDATVHVCENPTVVEVAAHRWARVDVGSAPVLVCTGGQPSTAVIELLETLTSHGAACRFHGDFDWGGLRIARVLLQRIAWSPWRYSAADYAALAAGPRSRALIGTPAGSPWEPALAAVMADYGLAIEEEAVADVLADDLVAEGGAE